MGTPSDQPDPSIYIDRLSDASALHREAAAWTLGEMGSLKAARPLAGLLLRELQTVERTGYLTHGAVVCAVVEAIRRLDAGEALYALVRALTALARAKLVDESIVVEIVDAIGDVGGPNAVREAADRVARIARGAAEPRQGLRVVGRVLLTRLSLCGDAAVVSLRRLAHGGPDPLKPIAQRVYATL